MPKPAAGRRVRQAQPARQREHVAGVKEADSLQVSHDLHAQLTVENHHAIAAEGKAGCAERVLVGKAIEREAAHGRVASREEPLARGQVADHLTVLDPLEPVGRAEPRAERDDRAPFHRQLTVDESLREGPDESDLGPDHARRNVSVDDDERPACRVEQVVAIVDDERAGHLRQTHFRKQLVDERRLIRLEELVEQLRLLERVPCR